MTDTNGITTRQLLERIDETNRRMDQRDERFEKMIGQLASIHRDTLLLINRIDDRVSRLESR